MVTKSDEAFGLLLLDNYLDKWIVQAEEEETAGTKPEAETIDGQEKNKRTKRIAGKYTEKKKGHCKYGGWSSAGMARFNQLYSLVKEDRASAKAEEMERELMAFSRARAGLHDIDDEQREGGTSSNDIELDETAESIPVEAAWDSDND